MDETLVVTAEPPEFVKFPSIKRLSRDMVVTEKIDGTNASIRITEDSQFLTGSRTRWITPGDDNQGFSQWAHENEEALRELGVGTHGGEWWGQGIQRKYGLDEKRFSLFNTGLWNAENTPDCVSVVPVLYTGPFSVKIVDRLLLTLHEGGSFAAPGFMNPEGVVIFHTHSYTLFKKTLDHNDEHKFLNVADPRKAAS